MKRRYSAQRIVQLAAASVQALLWPWLVVVLISVFAFTVAASSPFLQGTTWYSALQVGTSIWLLSFGAPMSVGGFTFALIPLTLTVIHFLVFYFCAKRAAVHLWSDVGITTICAIVVVTIIELLSSAGASRYIGTLGVALISVTAGACARLSFQRVEAGAHARSEGTFGGVHSFTEVSEVGEVRSDPGATDESPNTDSEDADSGALPGSRSSFLRWVSAQFAAMRTGLSDASTLMRPILTILVALSLLAVCVAVVVNLSTVRSIIQAYSTNAAGIALLVILQALWLPTLMVWALAYVLGAGFVVGAGTSFTPFGTVTMPLPALPVLGALPHPGSMWWIVMLIPLIMLVTGAIYGHRWRGFQNVYWAAAGLAGILALGGLVVSLLASGAIGPARLQQVGVSWWRLMIALIVGVGIPSVLGSLCRIHGGHVLRSVAHMGTRIRAWKPSSRPQKDENPDQTGTDQTDTTPLPQIQDAASVPSAEPGSAFDAGKSQESSQQ
ncbi:MAG: DUF6350 family protein [Actinomycetaceae bacterium]|nr:DUF6350 family protein [Actinomycetaceae bacterium]MDY6082903.1 DUF6350 family protein [Actinomycetaceae bacterium]